jgi:hypothetical protein
MVGKDLARAREKFRTKCVQASHFVPKGDINLFQSSSNACLALASPVAVTRAFAGSRFYDKATSCRPITPSLRVKRALANAQVRRGFAGDGCCCFGDVGGLGHPHRNPQPLVRGGHA